MTQKRHHFGFGSAVHHKHLEKHPAYRNFFLRNFEWGVPENAMKWPQMEEKKVGLFIATFKYVKNNLKTESKYENRRIHCWFHCPSIKVLQTWRVLDHFMVHFISVASIIICPGHAVGFESNELWYAPRRKIGQSVCHSWKIYTQISKERLT